MDLFRTVSTARLLLTPVGGADDRALPGAPQQDDTTRWHGHGARLERQPACSPIVLRHQKPYLHTRPRPGWRIRRLTECFGVKTVWPAAITHKGGLRRERRPEWWNR